VALANDDEMRALAAGGVFELSAPNLPSVLRQVELSGPPKLTDPTLPQRVTVPVIVLKGERTHPFYVQAAQDLAGRLPDARVETIAGAGHLGPQFVAEAVAEPLTSFLASGRVSA
jgi:pimeloyl-ACP methyl ester carboxylesterase